MNFNTLNDCRFQWLHDDIPCIGYNTPWSAHNDIHLANTSPRQHSRHDDEYPENAYTTIPWKPSFRYLLSIWQKLHSLRRYFLFVILIHIRNYFNYKILSHKLLAQTFELLAFIPP